MTYPVLGHGETSGTIYYNWPTKSYRIDRKNGKWDRYCGSVYKLTNTPCSHIVVEGKRYLYFPEKHDCCMCCTNKGGCGVLKPNWLDGSIYQGETVDAESNKKYQIFNQKGLQDNLVYIDEQTGHMARINQTPDDDQVYDVSTFTDQVDPKMFELPTICDPKKKCPWLSICTALSGVSAELV